MKEVVAGSSTSITVTSTGTTSTTTTMSGRSAWIMIPEYLEFKNILNSYLKCRSNKRNKYTSLKYEFDFEKSLLNLQKRLIIGSYCPSPSLCFVSNQPKKREIFASSFEDRIVHHIITKEMEKIFEPIFIYDSYSCRKDKGTHKAVNRLRKFIIKVSYQTKKNGYYLHADIKNFFPSINKKILFELIRKKINDPMLLKYIKENIFFDNTLKYRFVGKNIEELRSIPFGKSLFGKLNKKGIPIGNLTSQFYANVYLNQVDQFIKHELKCKYYVRYCDDMIIIDSSQESLKCTRLKIERFLEDKLKLKLNARLTKILPLNNGINFLGYIIRKDYNLVRRRVVANFRSKLSQIEKKFMIKTKKGIIFLFNYHSIDRVIAIINSYFGHLKHADSFRLKNSLLKRFSFLNEYFYLDGHKMVFKFKDKNFKHFRSQYKYFYERFKGCIILFQEGNLFKIYRKTSFKLEGYNNLNIYKTKFGFKLCYGFPTENIKEFESFCIETGKSFVTIVQFIKPSYGPIIRRVEVYFKNIEEKKFEYNKNINMKILRGDTNE